MAASNPIKVKILHKGLVLVILPCVIFGIFCWRLYDLQSRTEQLAAMEHKQLAIIARVNHLIALYSATSGCVASYISTGMPKFARGMREHVAELRQMYDELDRLTADQPAAHQEFQAIRRIAERQLSVFEAFGPPEGEPGEQSLLSLFARLSSHGLKDFMKRAGADAEMALHLGDQQQLRLEEIRQEQESSARQIKRLVLFGIVLNFLLALTLSLAFLGDITTRLSVLMDNAQRLPRLLPLNRQVGGADELTYLDGILHQSSDQLRAAQEQRQHLMQMVAHDIRSPLMSAQLSVGILKDDRIGELPEAAARQVDSLERNISRVTALTNDLLTIDKLEAGQLELNLETVDVHRLVENALGSVAQLAQQKRIELSNRCLRQEVLADGGRIEQVLINLLSNAIKFSPAGTTISVVSEGAGKAVRVGVKDEGPGIPEADRHKVFDKFFQLEKGGSRGFGLGLAICKLIVQAHQGTVGVDSEPGQGSCFWFTIPAAEPGA